jgi:hypothetical protein
MQVRQLSTDLVNFQQIELSTFNKIPYAVNRPRVHSEDRQQVNLLTVGLGLVKG